MRTWLDNVSHFFMGFGLNLISFLMYKKYSGITILVYALLTMLFVIYELNEDWHISDDAYVDIFYFGWGIGISYIILFILDFFKLFFCY